MIKLLSRRTILRGLGVCINLPILEAMIPSFAWASNQSSNFPRRMAFVYVPNGVNMNEWRPKEEGPIFTLPPTLEPLKDYREELLVLSGLTADKARPNGDGPGDHARAMSAFLTGCQPKKTSGANIKVGTSVDQLAAQKIGNATRFSSLEIGCEGGRQAGNCDSGYSCAYSSTISWKNESSPVAKETNPRLVFQRLFSASGQIMDATTLKNSGYKRSIIDFVAEDARSLQRKLGGKDIRKLDEYLGSIREIELRLARLEKESDLKDVPSGVTPPNPTPRSIKEHLQLLCDMMVLGFQTDQTRICTFVFANEGSNRSYNEIQVPDGHHDLSHHGRNKEKLAKIQKINRFHVDQFAYLIGKLKAIREGQGTLLDNCMIVYGSGNSDGDRHNHDDLPILLLGRAGGTLKPGRHLVFPQNTPLNNLWLELLDRIDVKLDRFGDSTGRLKNLNG